MSDDEQPPRPRATILPPSADGHGLSVWLSPRDARRLAVLARDADTSMGEKLCMLIGDAFGKRFRVPV